LFVDGNGIASGTRMSVDVCIVGGGPAAITVALELAGSKNSVWMLESGGLTEEPEAKAMNEGEDIGLPYFPLDETRHRLLGGSSTRWAGWCRRLDPIDLESRDWVPDSGWPIAYQELDRFYPRAVELCQIPQDQFDQTDHESIPDLYRPPFIGGDVETALWNSSPPTKFGAVYGDDLQAAENVTVSLHSTAVEILTDESGQQATGVRVANSVGMSFEIDARVVVVAAGAIESARLLLASRTSNPDGLGNDKDLVGRYFTEHPHMVTGRIVIGPSANGSRPFLPSVDLGFKGAKARLSLQRPVGGIKVAYTLDEGRQRSEQLLNYSAHLRSTSPLDREESAAYAALKLIVENLRSPKRLARQVKDGTLPDGVGTLTKNLLKGSPEIAQAIYYEAFRKPDAFALYTQSESAPNRDSRVTVNYRDVDSVGLPRVRLDWQLSRIDKESLVRSQEILGAQLESAGLGRLEPSEPFRDDGPDWGPRLRGGHHQMGTTRMSESPEHGVVDTDCMVHGVDGLFVAGQSVFPTVGYSNPLLTAVALSARLGDHLVRTVL
jgi:choline dehydrogenase-like flavoprotein